MRARHHVAYAVVLGLSAVAAPADAIMRRDDVDDGEYVVDPGEYPAVVDLLAPGDCVATLVADQWLVTAAHCAAYLPAERTIPIAGTPRAVEGVVCHPDYRGFDHDLALVRLAAPVEDVLPLGLYRQSDEVGRSVLFVGRGDTGTGIEGQPSATNDGQTRAATNNVIDADDKWIEFVFNRPDDAEVSAREGISGDGDSGGPALIDVGGTWFVAGISSWQDADDPDVGKYGVHEFYTRVSSYLGFLDTTMGPDWDGQLRPCPQDPEEGCRIGGTGATPPLWLLVVPLFGWRRRTRRSWDPGRNLICHQVPSCVTRARREESRVAGLGGYDDADPAPCEPARRGEKRATCPAPASPLIDRASNTHSLLPATETGGPLVREENQSGNCPSSTPPPWRGLVAQLTLEHQARVRVDHDPSP